MHFSLNESIKLYCTILSSVMYCKSQVIVASPTPMAFSTGTFSTVLQVNFAKYHRLGQQTHVIMKDGSYHATSHTVLNQEEMTNRESNKFASSEDTASACLQIYNTVGNNEIL